MEEVRARARALGMKNTFGLLKAELIRRVQKAEGNFDCFRTAIRAIVINSNVASERIVSDS